MFELELAKSITLYLPEFSPRLCDGSQPALQSAGTSVRRLCSLLACRSAAQAQRALTNTAIAGMIGVYPDAIRDANIDSMLR
jgi:hypothetical protein